MPEPRFQTKEGGKCNFPPFFLRRGSTELKSASTADHSPLSYRSVPRLPPVTICDMNVSYPLPFIANLPPTVEQAALDCLRTAASLLIPGEILYFAIYFHRRRYEKLYAVLTCLSLAAFGFSLILAPVSCGPIQCVQNFAGKFHTQLYDFQVTLPLNL